MDAARVVLTCEDSHREHKSLLSWCESGDSAAWRGSGNVGKAAEQENQGVQEGEKPDPR